MKIVIDVPDEIIMHCKNHSMPDDCTMFARKIIEDIAKGKILPKGHGRLIDADAINNRFDGIWFEAENVSNKPTYKYLLDKLNMCIDTAPTIIDADKGE